MPTGIGSKALVTFWGHTMYGLRGISWIYDVKPSNDDAIRLKFEYDGMLSPKKVSAILTDAINGSDINWFQPQGNDWRFDLARMKAYFGNAQVPDWQWLNGFVFVEPEFEHAEKSDSGRHGRSQFTTRFEFMITQQSSRHSRQQIGDPVELTESLARFRADQPDPSKTAFLIMRFADSKPHSQITDAIRQTLNKHGIRGIRADDKEYHPELFGNVRTYLHGCGFGMAVFDRIDTEHFNPNVSLEVGYLMAMGKPVCLLKDKSLTQLQTDLVSRLYRTFDVHNPAETIERELKAWLTDKELIPSNKVSG